MHRMLRTFMQTLPFPEAVSTYLVRRFPEYIDALLSNESVPPGAFAHVAAAKEKADTAVSLVSIDSPPTVSAWCASKDKRQGVSDVVFRNWQLPLAEQMLFVAKALTEDSANQVLRSSWFADAAKLVAAPRAHVSSVWSWLESDPAGLSDDEWFRAFDAAASRRRHVRLIDEAPYATLAQRPHLAQRLIDEGCEQAAMLAVSRVADIDATAALRRIMACSDNENCAAGLVALLDHPSLPQAVRVDAFEYAREHNHVAALYRIGVPSPNSPLDLGVPLASISDPLLVEMIAMRAFTASAPRAYHFVELAAAPGAGAQLLHRFAELPRGWFVDAPAAAKIIAALARKVDATAVLDESAPQITAALQAFDTRRTEQDATAQLTAPVRSGRPWSTRYYRSSDDSAPIPSPESMLDAPLDDLPGMLAGYRANPKAAKAFTELLVASLGDGSVDTSLAKWEQCMQLFAKTNGTMRARQVIAAAARLR